MSIVVSVVFDSVVSIVVSIVGSVVFDSVV